ncbi:MAG: DUF2333 domain-containing protein [Gammaproteobacteria bacterium HGW-Gammaproteobacteria-3]|nr:MAG: DUF2333 domain-containing protein [Gammaproteobacteria bacterium HGW-Gammaproteobacteria-3]
MSESDLPRSDQHKGLKWSIGVIVAILLIVEIILGAWWGAEPGSFSVYDEAIARTQETNTTTMPVGFVYANTLAKIADVILHKPGGYITNDVAPPGVFLDNISSWEYGALVMLRDGATALRNHFARDQSQSAEDPDLAMAEPYFYYERNSWALPSTEAEYEKGIAALHRYMARLQDPKRGKPAYFYSRADNLWQYIEIVIKRLGGLSTRLSASGSGSEMRNIAFELPPDPDLTATEQKIVDLKTAPIRATPWLEIDNVFYEARGASWALLHILRAIEHDFRDILIDKRAMNTVDIMIHAMENSLGPILSPMILDGGGFGLFANYSLTMANYIARANAAALDLRDLMNRG